jgi:hypothetical protein
MTPQKKGKNSEEDFSGVEDAVFAGVVEGDVGVGVAVAVVDFAGVERFGVNVDTDGALIEFGEIENLVDGFERIDVGGMRGVHVVDVGGIEMTGAEVGVFVGDMKILDAEFADGSGHPTVLIAMIVDAAGLANLPADGHTFEDVILEN